MQSNDQQQEVSEGGFAIQAKGNVTVTTGLSYLEVREVALDVFKGNFYKLKGAAAEVATARAEEITEKFLKKLQTESPAGLEQSQDPDFQYALFNVQKEYARNGDKNLGDLLVDLLVDRSKQEKRDILQIVLDEAISTAPKLTENQLAVLALVFLLKYTQNRGVGSHAALGEYLDKYALPFVSKVVTNQACYQHLEFCGCGSISIARRALETVLGTTYHGLFVNGFDQKEVVDRGISIGPSQDFFLPCLNDPSKFQVNALNKEALDGKFEERSISPEDRAKITALFEAANMSDAQINEKCVSTRAYMADVFKSWSGSSMPNLMLTSVGIAIGHVNIKRFAGEFADLSIWIN
jgi:hypothetical protein